MIALNRKLFRDVVHMRGQLIAISLVVACGVASFVAMRDTYQSLLRTQQAYYLDYRFADLFVSVKRAPEQLKVSLGQIPGVAAVETRAAALVTLDIPMLEEPALGRLISIPETQAPMLNDLHLISGRYIEPTQPNEVIISAAFAEKNGFRPGDSIKAMINGRWTGLFIVGTALSPEYVYEIRPFDMFPDNRRFGVIWMSRRSLAAAIDMEGAFNDASMTLSPGANEEKVIEQIDALLDSYGSQGAYGREDQTSNHFVTNELAELKVNGTVTPSIFLLVTAFLIHMVLSRLVGSQRDQIAVLKAFGYTDRAIAFHYLKLALLIVSGGIFAGVLAGWLLGHQITVLYAEFFRFPILRHQIDPIVIAFAALVALTAAGVGALWSVRKAVGLPPAEAMRPEPPARYHLGWVERLGLKNALPLSLRIILRNLERNPVKAALSMLGVAMSVSLLVVGFFIYDAIDHIVQVQFYTKFHHDVMVNFDRPLSSKARHDLAGFPGVLRVEPARIVAVKMRGEHRMKRTVIFGLEPSATLHRLADSDLNTYQLPIDGLTLTTNLANALGVKIRDKVTIEILEGARKTKEIVVVAIIDELVGSAAYMNIAALNQILDDGGSITSAYLKVDPQFILPLYHALKRTPRVSSVWVLAAWLENFYATIARTLRVSTSVTVIFSAVIAMGIVYNSARIALSERGRELASLRILGFSQAEVSRMLLGEQTILTAAAIPVGFGFGYLLCYLISRAIDTELMRIPLVFSGRTWLLSFLVIGLAAIFSGLLVHHRLQRLDLIEVLKTRE